MTQKASMRSPLDFELEDPLLDSPAPAKRRKKVIGLDDLLTDYYKEKDKCIEGELKSKKARKIDSSDEEDNAREATLSSALDKYHKQMQDMGGDDEISHWGLHVFGTQKSLPELVLPELHSYGLLQSFYENKHNSLVGLRREEGDTFLEGLLVNGWLLKLITVQNHVEEVIAKWVFNLMMFSSKGKIRTSACDFWCSILSLKNEDNASPIRIDWVPNYSDIGRALDVYGYICNSSSNWASHTDCDLVEPSKNIQTWIKFVTAFCEVRSKRIMLSTSEAVELIIVVISLFLDRRLGGLSILLYKCLVSTINYLTDDEWNTSSEKIAKCLACRVPRDLNCLRVVECISGVDGRSKSLRSKVAYEILAIYLDAKVANDEEILNILMSIKVKERSCDLFKVYICLILAENWLMWGPKLEDRPVICEMWGVFLRSCSFFIASTDLRSYASKVRNRASYLLHGSSTD
ncbi:hypothetical protein SAY87_006272 [Trapa incisa]|uniref:Coiled-coil SMC6 And NSE5 INteracting (CANIN) domain-containing protein n=1 Tax=Trapa incisa TaxID=236973 RepID=A0AAN7K1Z6_9MYRT|nr:hypothetical protein SAY87_006272 [Trapa incisa]